MKGAIYSGSFDPFTLGHLDIAKRGSKIFDNLIILIASSPLKTDFLIPIDIRKSLIEKICKNNGLNNIKVDILTDNLLADYCIKSDIHIIIRGIRSQKDAEYENNMAYINKNIAASKSFDLETLYIASNPKYSYLSSSLVRLAYQQGVDISQYTPKEIFQHFKSAF